MSGLTRARIALSLLLLRIAAMPLGAIGQVWILDSFEQTIRVVQPGEIEERSRFLWGLYTSNGPAGVSTTDLSSAEHHDGIKSLHNRYDPTNAIYKNWQFHFYPYTIGGSLGLPDGWNYARQFVAQPSSYQTGRVNRLRFWVKLPAATVPQTGGNHNFEFGTYLRDISWSHQDAENNNWHFYHFFNFYPTGQWEQVIVDAHASHQRGFPGGTEYREILHPSTETPALTYFDLMTRFYFDFPYLIWPNTGNDFYIDGVEFYEETAVENIDQVFSVHATYAAPSNTLRLGWSRRKDQESIKHEVRYAWSDIHTSGWAAATPAPAGIITPVSGSGPYQCLEYTTAQINMAGHSVIYLAIQPQQATTFTQIAVPIGSTITTQPGAPSNLIVR